MFSVPPLLTHHLISLSVNAQFEATVAEGEGRGRIGGIVIPVVDVVSVVPFPIVCNLRILEALQYGLFRDEALHKCTFLLYPLAKLVLCWNKRVLRCVFGR